VDPAVVLGLHPRGEQAVQLVNVTNQPPRTVGLTIVGSGDLDEELLPDCPQ
jgi:hypothetical protein